MNYLDTKNNIIIDDISLDELAKIENLSIKTRGMLLKANLTSLPLILKYYKLNHHFLKLYQCDYFLNKELLILCKKYFKLNLEKIKTEHKNPTKTKRIIIENPLANIAGFEGITVRSYNVLFKANLTSLSLVLEYYKCKHDFLRLKNCGFDSNNELIKFCKRHTSILYETMIDLFPQNKSETTYINNYENPLDKIAGFKGLSDSSCILLYNANFTSLNLVLDYYYSNLSFLKIIGCKSNTNNEIIMFCKKHSSLLYETMKEMFSQTELDTTNINVVKSKTIIEKLDTFNSIQLLFIENYYNQLLSNLDIQNLKILKRKIYINNYKELFMIKFENDFFFKNIDNNIIIEFIELKSKLQNYIHYIYSLDNKQILKIYIKQLLDDSIPEIQTDIDNKIDSIFDKDDKIKVCSLIDLVFNNNTFFNYRRHLIFKYIYYNDNYEKESLDSIALKIGVKRNRVIDIKDRFEREFVYFIKDIIKYLGSNIKYYDLEVKPLNIIKYTILENINHAEEVNFNSDFYAVVFKVLLNISDSNNNYYRDIKFRIENKNKLKIQEIYLVKKDLLWFFDFEKFIKMFDTLIKSNVKVSYELKFEEFLKEFIKKGNLEYFYEIKLICLSIIQYKYNLIPNNVDNIIIERTTPIKDYDYYVYIIEKNGSPMTINQLSDQLNLKYPNLNSSKKFIKEQISNNKFHFINIGRGSKFGIKEWEKDYSNVIGLTYGDIVANYLLDKNEPMHISDIVNHINLLDLKTYERSLIRVLEVERKKRFVFYKGGFIGLESKQYSNEFNIKVKPGKLNGTKSL